MKGGARHLEPEESGELTEYQQRKRAKRLCITFRCQNRAQKTGKYHRLHCAKCRSRVYAQANPIRIKWLNLKKSAKKRGKEWRLVSFECFRCIATMYGYTEFQERGADALTVDRKEEEGPYCFSNIQFLPNGENARKAAEWRRKSYVPYYQQMGICG